MKYRKRPVIIEAHVFEDSAESIIELQEFMNGADIRIDYGGLIPRLLVATLEGDVWASAGDYVIKGVKGEFYPCKPDIFEATYDLVEELRHA